MNWKESWKWNCVHNILYFFCKSSTEPSLKHQTVDMLCHDALSPISVDSFINRRIKLISTRTLFTVWIPNFLLRLLWTMAKRPTIGTPIETSLSLTHISFKLCTAFILFYFIFILSRFALFFVILHCVYRIHTQNRKLNVSEYFQNVSLCAVFCVFGVPKTTNRSLWTRCHWNCQRTFQFTARFHLPISIWMLFFFDLRFCFVLLCYFPSVTFRNGENQFLLCVFFAVCKEHHTQNIGIL